MVYIDISIDTFIIEILTNHINLPVLWILSIEIAPEPWNKDIPTGLAPTSVINGVRTPISGLING